MSHRGQSHLKTITRARPVSLKPPIQHLLCIGALKGLYEAPFLAPFFLAPHSSSFDSKGDTKFSSANKGRRRRCL